MRSQLVSAERVSGAGNRFLLVDVRERGLPGDPAGLARRVCRDEFCADGVLFLLAPEGGADFRMIVHNRDGSRPEACGNGLRCLAAHAANVCSAERLLIETDAGVRDVRVTGEGDVEVSMGEATVVEDEIDVLGRVLPVTLVDVGNPHCVVFGLAPDELEAWGPALERHPRFPAGTNVELCELADDGVRLRVWERGVGETASCGSGAVAAASAAARHLDLPWPIRVESPGGVLTVDRDGLGVLWLSGDVATHGTVELAPE